MNEIISLRDAGFSHTSKLSFEIKAPMEIFVLLPEVQSKRQRIDWNPLPHTPPKSVRSDFKFSDLSLQVCSETCNV